MMYTEMYTDFLNLNEINMIHTLQKEFYAVSEKLYQAQAQAGAAGANPAGDAAPGADNVYDADFTDVDDTKN